ncbi:Endonuclease/exonuclease/phosphatase [Gaertneriomyces semiglobifer]|nr:Endonuclease/exonuclease/phosphatase [Gaertneriomyces semiglobifer]
MSNDTARILVGTFNLATRTPKPETGNVPDLLDWLSITTDDTSAVPDVVAIGFQELVSQARATRLSTKDFYCEHDVQNTADITAQKEFGLEELDTWVDIVGQTLNSWYADHTVSTKSPHGASPTEAIQESVQYRTLCVSRMVALGLVIFVRSDNGARFHVTDVWEGCIGTGLLGFYGNKGATCVGLDLVATGMPERTWSTCFLNVHLGPHEGEYYFHWRNQEVGDILQALCLRSCGNPNAVRQLDNFQNQFFFGDMNYRLQRPVNNAEAFTKDVMRLIDNQDIEGLLALDELTHIREKKQLPPLRGFLEPLIRFLPSYKYDVGREREPDAAKSARIRYATKRLPAYCDRIMYRVSDGTRESHGADDQGWAAAKRRTAAVITPLCYHCADSVMWSDHKPVTALFSVKLESLSAETPIRDAYAIVAHAKRIYRHRILRTVARSTTVQVAVVLTVTVLSWIWLAATGGTRRSNF